MNWRLHFSATRCWGRHTVQYGNTQAIFWHQEMFDGLQKIYTINHKIMSCWYPRFFRFVFPRLLNMWIALFPCFSGFKHGSKGSFFGGSGGLMSHLVAAKVAFSVFDICRSNLRKAAWAQGRSIGVDGSKWLSPEETWIKPNKSLINYIGGNYSSVY